MDKFKINQAVEYIRNNKETLISVWEERAREEISAAKESRSLFLRDHLVDLLEDLAKSLEHATIWEEPRCASEEFFTKSRSEQYGENRSLGPSTYRVHELLEEYVILRQVITDRLATEGLGDLDTLEALNRMFELASLWAVKAFTDKSEESNQKIISTLVHDIRSPIGVALSALEVLEDYLVDEEIGVKMYGMIKRSLERSLDMITTSLDNFSVTSRFKLTLNFEKVNLSVVFKDTLIDLKQVYGEKLVLGKFDEGIEGVFAQSLLIRVLENLVSNAFKFGTPLSDVKVSLIDMNDQVELSIHNWGNPIPKERLEEIFESYQTTSRQIQRRPSGWGLGLSHVGLAAKAHEGKVQVLSSQEYGTEFKVSLKKNSHDQGRRQFSL